MEKEVIGNEHICVLYDASKLFTRKIIQNNSLFYIIKRDIKRYGFKNIFNIIKKYI